MVELVIAASSGFGHIEPSVRLANYYMTEESVCVTLILPAAKGIKLPELPPQRRRLRVIHIELSPERAAPIAGAAALIAQRKRVVSDVIATTGLAERPIAAIIYDMLSIQWCSMLADALNVPQFVFVPAHLPLTYLSYRHPEYFKRKDALRVPNAEHEKQMSFRPAGARIPPPMVGDIEIPIPGVAKPVSGSDLFEFPPDVWHVIVDGYQMFHRAQGAIVQDLPSFYTEPEKLIEAIEKDQTAAAIERGVPNPRPFKVYSAGALAMFDTRQMATTEAPEIAWLDQQPPRSVIYVASGTWCQISVADTVELARGIQMSNMPFLWAYRARGGPETFSDERPLPEEAEESGLPATFRKETKEQGLILPWVNQMAVLNHPAIACFMTHCGWNSVMEALVWAGVPLVLLPAGADQGVNANVLENEWRCGKRIWDVSRHRRLERSSVARVIRECAFDEEMKRKTREMQNVLKEAASPNGLVSLERARFLASLS